MMKKLLKLGICSLPVLIVVLLVAQIFVSNALASFGENMRNVDSRIAILQEENDLLSQQIASSSSLVTIAARATEFGFFEPVKGQIMTMAQDQFPVAFK